MPYDPVKLVLKFLGTLDYWQWIGYIGEVLIVSIFSFLERFPLCLKVLYHCVPRDVGSGDGSSSGLIVSYHVTRGKESLMGLFSKDEGWC